MTDETTPARTRDLPPRPRTTDLREHLLDHGVYPPEVDHVDEEEPTVCRVTFLGRETYVSKLSNDTIVEMIGALDSPG